MAVTVEEVLLETEDVCVVLHATLRQGPDGWYWEYAVLGAERE